MQVQPYLFFNGRTEDALGFYGRAIGAKTEMLMRFEDSPQPPAAGCAPVSGDKVMHASFRIGDSVLFASDGPNPEGEGFRNVSLSLQLGDEGEAQRRFTALADGGKVTMPLGKTFFAKSFGMLVDRFGLSWMVIVPAPMP